MIEHYKLKQLIKTILITDFKVPAEHFQWDTALYLLHPKFKLLGYLVDLETIIKLSLNEPITLTDSINVFMHTSLDIIDVVERQLTR